MNIYMQKSDIYHTDVKVYKKNKKYHKHARCRGFVNYKSI